MGCFLSFSFEYSKREVDYSQANASECARGFLHFRQMSALPCVVSVVLICSKSLNIFVVWPVSAVWSCSGPVGVSFSGRREAFVNSANTCGRLATLLRLRLLFKTKDDSDCRDAPGAQAQVGRRERGFLEHVWQSLLSFPRRPKHGEKLLARASWPRVSSHSFLELGAGGLLGGSCSPAAGLCTNAALQLCAWAWSCAGRVSLVLHGVFRLISGSHLNK